MQGGGSRDGDDGCEGAGEAWGEVGGLGGGKLKLCVKSKSKAH